MKRKRKKPKRKPAHATLATVPQVRRWLERGGVQYFSNPMQPAMTGVDVAWDDEKGKMKITARRRSLVDGEDDFIAEFHLPLPITPEQMRMAAAVVVKRFDGEWRRSNN